MAEYDEWEDIAGYENEYQITRCGRVRSKDKLRERHINSNFFVRGKELKPSLRNGYKRIGLMNGNSRKSYSVHRLVYTTFVGPISTPLQINHKDGNKGNNNIKNLELVTASQNCLHRDENKLRIPASGEKCGRSKLKAENINIIRKSRLSQRKLAIKFKVSQAAIWMVINNKSWRVV